MNDVDEELAVYTIFAGAAVGAMVIVLAAITGAPPLKIAACDVVFALPLLFVLWLVRE